MLRNSFIWLFTATLMLSVSIAQDGKLGRGNRPSRPSNDRPKSTSDNQKGNSGYDRPKPPSNSGNNGSGYDRPKPPSNSGNVGSGSERPKPSSQSDQNRPRPPITSGNTTPASPSQNTRPRPPLDPRGSAYDREHPSTSQDASRPTQRIPRQTVPGSGYGNDSGLNSKTLRESRSGKVNYQSSNNFVGKVREPIIISRPPIDSLANQVLRSDNIRVNSGWRNGYCGYSNSWNDNYFNYPFYSFNWSRNDCAISPWYWYSHLPGYINRNRCRFDRPTFQIIVNLNYDWSPIFSPGYRYNDYGYGYGRNERNWGLDRAIEDIVEAFLYGEFRVLSDLLPRRGDVYVTIDQGYQYSLQSDDFYDLMVDNLSTTRTQRYKIISARTGRGTARIVAEHEFTDPWGRRQLVYHTFGLLEDSRRFTIAEFSSSQMRPAW